MALWFGLRLGFVFYKLLLRSFGGLGPGLEPGKRINYTPFSYSLSRTSHPFFPFPFPSLLFLPVPFPSFSLVLSPSPSCFPGPDSSIFLACHPSVCFCFSISVFLSLLWPALSLLAPRSVPPEPFSCQEDYLHPPSSLSRVDMAGDEQRNQAFSRGPPRGSVGLQVSALCLIT